MFSFQFNRTKGKIILILKVVEKLLVCGNTKHPLIMSKSKSKQKNDKHFPKSRKKRKKIFSQKNLFLSQSVELLKIKEFRQKRDLY